MAELNAKQTSTLARAIAIITNPGDTWKAIAAEDTTTDAVFKGYVLPLALVGPLCGFVGGRVFGTGLYGTLASTSLTGELIGAVFAFVLSMICYVFLTQIASGMAPRFGGKVSNLAATQLVAYSATPVWLGGLFSLYPPLTRLGFLALYSIYLVYRGVGPVLDVPQDKAMKFTVTYVTFGLILNLVVIAMTMASGAMIAGMGLSS